MPNLTDFEDAFDELYEAQTEARGPLTIALRAEEEAEWMFSIEALISERDINPMIDDGGQPDIGQVTVDVKTAQFNRTIPVKGEWLAKIPGDNPQEATDTLFDVLNVQVINETTLKLTLGQMAAR